MGATAQLNARMSQELKSSGDKVLAEAGISPTKLVRLVWEKAASGNDGLRQLLEVLQNNDVHEHNLLQDGKHTNAEDRAARGEQLFEEGIARLGLSQEVATRVPTTSDWKDQREKAIADRLSERGIL